MTQDLPAAALARRALLLAAPLVMLGTVPAALAQAEAVPVRFAYNPSAPIGTYIAATGTDAFAREGIRLDTQRFSEPAAALDAIASRQVQLGGIGFAGALQAISLGQKLRMIAAFEYTFTDTSGHPWEAVFMIARKDAAVRSVKDLKGKKVAILGVSSTWYLALRDAGVDVRDITFLSMPYTQMAGALTLGQVDVATITSTEYVRLGQRLPVDVVMTGSQLTGLKLDLTQVIVARHDWLRENQPLAVSFLKAMLRTRAFMRQDIAANEGATIKRFIREQLKFDDLLTDTFYRYRAGYAGRELAFVNDLDVPRHVVDVYARTLEGAGLLRGAKPAGFDLAVDLTYLKRAHAELGLRWDDAKTLD
ncbi:hypothetical protein FHP25_21270 [Vineibacter terrae]|uniref:SsuA/THI5-like domain-containing protein n=1 Tax=Vineibacter terrae TaxID=2586908 RepID=A0A5C8PI22_9HYPH|nr:ABC transporter substrate-binding protein [Vineibacter terrae]TXL73464.1 hypothetical protein FHP25_21270 [Vineibacter terrae]